VNTETEKLSLSWREFSAIEFTETEKILFELGRGEVGVLIAATNIGKTTLALNLAISLAAGDIFPPIVTENTEPKRVIVIDGETTSSRLQWNIQRMLASLAEDKQQLVKENLFIINEPLLDAPFQLSTGKHMEALIEEMRSLQPDLIIVDTLSALFSLNSENDNAEVTKRVMRPLDLLAKETNSAVLVLHHVGKQSEESLVAVRAYRGRGASAIGAHARLVLLLQRDSRDKECVVLSCAKVKGERFDDVLLRLDNNSRWFYLMDESPEPIQSKYQLVVDTVRAFNQPTSRKEIEKSLIGRVSSSNLTVHLKEAIRRGDLKSPIRGIYESANAQMLSSIDVKQIEQNSTVN
jgi:hypothetical protein